MTPFRMLAFGDLATETWGVSWIAGPDAATHLAVGQGSAAGRLDGLQTGQRGEDWRLEGDAASLLFSPTGPAANAVTDALKSSDQLCEVSGTLRVEGADAEVRCLGWHSSVDAASELGDLDSLRHLAGWLNPRDGFSLIALRPRKARGHDADLAAASLIEDPPAPAVVDPRLSTTYTATGVPARAGLELWLKEEAEERGEAEEEAEGEAPHRYPRRAAGEVVGSGVDWEQGDLQLHASLLHWHSHGREGPGIYVLGQRR